MKTYKCSDCGMKIESEKTLKRCPYCKGKVAEFSSEFYTTLADNDISVPNIEYNCAAVSSSEKPDTAGTIATESSKCDSAFGEIFTGVQSSQNRTSLYKTNKLSKYKRSYTSGIIIGLLLFIGLVALTIYYFYKMIPFFADLRVSMSGLREAENNLGSLFLKVIVSLVINTPVTALVYTPVLLLSSLCIALFASSSGSAPTKGKKTLAQTFLALSILILVGSLLVTVGLSLYTIF